MIGQTYKNTPKSAYAPPKAVADFTSVVQKAYQSGEEILTKGWTELNEYSVVEDLNRGQKMFNAHVDENIEDPAEAWKWRGTRSMARNKGIGMHAQLTAAFLRPSFSAQNEDDEVDRDFSDTMDEIVEWMTLPTNSDYQSSFITLVFGMIEAPVVYLGAEFYEVYQQIKEKTDKGYERKQVLDEVFSGFKAPVYSADQILISNPYERNIQKQKCLIKRRWIEYQEAEAKYGKHKYWLFVQPGVNTIFNSENGLFYDIKDPDHETLVLEVTYLNRREDTEVCFLGGIYMGNDDVDMNPIKHRDHQNAPKYNLTPFGFYRIGTHFFYYKSMMNAMGWDNTLYDAMSEILMNRAILEVEMPVSVSGSDKIDSEVIFPNSVVTFADKDTKVNSLLPPSNMAAGFQALMATKDSMDDASLSDVSLGQLPQATQKAYSVAQAQANAKKLIAGVAKSLAESVVQYGPLMADIAINNLTAPQVDEITGENTRLKYRKFILEKQMVDGKEVNKEIRFEESLIGKEMTQQEKDDYSLGLLEEVGYPDNKKSVRVINPHLWSKFRYLARIDPEEMFPRNSETMQALLTNLYTMLIQDPYTNKEALHKELMYSYFRGKSAKFTQKPPAVAPEQPKDGKGNQLGSMVNAKQMANVASGLV